MFDGYRIVREVHGSSRSHIYLAVDIETDAVVTIKIPSIDLRDDPGGIVDQAILVADHRDAGRLRAAPLAPLALQPPHSANRHDDNSGSAGSDYLRG